MLSLFFFSSRRRHTRYIGDWSSDVCSSDLLRSQGKDDQASQAGSELPDKIDTDNAQHAGILSKYGIDPGNIRSEERRVGKECRAAWGRSTQKKTTPTETA